MAKGVKTGGRKPGSTNKRTQKLKADVAGSGLTPLEYMLVVMRDEAIEPRERLSAAQSAAPYVHPRLANVTLGGDQNAPFRFDFPWLKQALAQRSG